MSKNFKEMRKIWMNKNISKGARKLRGALRFFCFDRSYTKDRIVISKTGADPERCNWKKDHSKDHNLFSFVFLLLGQLYIIQWQNTRNKKKTWFSSTRPKNDKYLIEICIIWQNHQVINYLITRKFVLNVYNLIFFYD